MCDKAWPRSSSCKPPRPLLRPHKQEWRRPRWYEVPSSRILRNGTKDSSRNQPPRSLDRQAFFCLAPAQTADQTIELPPWPQAFVNHRRSRQHRHPWFYSSWRRLAIDTIRATASRYTLGAPSSDPNSVSASGSSIRARTPEPFAHHGSRY